MTVDKYRFRKSRKYKMLTQEEQTIIVELLGRGTSNAHTAEELAELTGTEIAPAHVQYYRRTRAVEIAKIKEAVLKDRDASDAHFADPWVRLVALSRTAEELLRTKQYPEFRRYMHEISVQMGEQSPQTVIQVMYEQVQKRGGGGIEVVMVNLKEAVGDDGFMELQAKMDAKYLAELDADAIDVDFTEDDDGDS